MFKRNKEKDQNIEIKYAKLKIHTGYIIAIAVIFAIIGIAVGLGKNYNFAAEISMASTITSIVLSVIAIFMSISGENKNSYTQNKIMETADGLADVVEKMKGVEKVISDTLDEKLYELTLIKNELKGIKENVYRANDKLQLLTADAGKVEEYNVSTKAIKEDVNAVISNDQIVNIFKRMNYNDLGNKVVAEILEYIIVVFLRTEDIKTIESEEIYEYMRENDKMPWEKIDFNIFWGVARAFSTLGVDRRNKEVCTQLLSEIHNLTNENNEEKILSFSKKYQREPSK